MARANYKQNPKLQTWFSNTMKQRNVKTVKHATEFFQQLTTIESIYLNPRKAIKQQNRSTHLHKEQAPETFSVDNTYQE